MMNRFWNERTFLKDVGLISSNMVTNSSETDSKFRCESWNFITCFGAEPSPDDTVMSSKRSTFSQTLPYALGHHIRQTSDMNLHMKYLFDRRMQCGTILND